MILKLENELLYIEEQKNKYRDELTKQLNERSKLEDPIRIKLTDEIIDIYIEHLNYLNMRKAVITKENK